jgi:hypothetical protein
MLPRCYLKSLRKVINMGKNAPAGADDDSFAPWLSYKREPEDNEYDKYADYDDLEEDDQND